MMKDWITKWTAGGFVLVLTSCGGPHLNEQAKELLLPFAVETQRVQLEVVPVYESVVGTVRPRYEAGVSAKLTGRILTLEAVPGQRVKRGDVLCLIDAGELNASLEAARATLEQAQRDLERSRRLFEGRATSQAEYEKAAAQQQVSAARVSEVESMISNATVTAPFDGVITRRLMEPGDLAVPGRVLFTLEDSSLLRLEINAAESLAGGIELGQMLRVEVQGAGADVQGKVSEIAPSADAGSRTFLVKLDLPSRGVLRAGLFGRAYLPRGTRQALRVPRSSIAPRGQMDYLFVAAEGVARLRIVRTGEQRDGKVEILAGVEDGEQIVLDPPAGLQNGQPLTTVQ